MLVHAQQLDKCVCVMIREIEYFSKRLESSQEKDCQ